MRLWVCGLGRACARRGVRKCAREVTEDPESASWAHFALQRIQYRAAQVNPNARRTPPPRNGPSAPLPVGECVPSLCAGALAGGFRWLPVLEAIRKPRPVYVQLYMHHHLRTLGTYRGRNHGICMLLKVSDVNGRDHHSVICCVVIR